LCKIFEAKPIEFQKVSNSMMIIICFKVGFLFIRLLRLKDYPPIVLLFIQSFFVPLAANSYFLRRVHSQGAIISFGFLILGSFFLKHSVTCRGDYRRGFGLDTGFIDNLYTRHVSTSNYSATTNLCNSQITTVPAKPFPACCIFTSRSWQRFLTVEILKLHALKSSIHRLQYRIH
jgi:hypothetical protein